MDIPCFLPLERQLWGRTLRAGGHLGLCSFRQFQEKALAWVISAPVYEVRTILSPGSLPNMESQISKVLVNLGPWALTYRTASSKALRSKPADVSCIHNFLISLSIVHPPSSFYVGPWLPEGFLPAAQTSQGTERCKFSASLQLTCSRTSGAGIVEDLNKPGPILQRDQVSWPTVISTVTLVRSPVIFEDTHCNGATPSLLDQTRPWQQRYQKHPILILLNSHMAWKNWRWSLQCLGPSKSA